MRESLFGCTTLARRDGPRRGPQPSTPTRVPPVHAHAHVRRRCPLLGLARSGRVDRRRHRPQCRALSAAASTCGSCRPTCTSATCWPPMGWSVSLVPDFVPGTIAVAHWDELHRLRWRAPLAYLIGVRADRPPLCVADKIVRQNTLRARRRLPGRHPAVAAARHPAAQPERGDRVQRIGYFGRLAMAPRFLLRPRVPSRGRSARPRVRAQRARLAGLSRRGRRHRVPHRAALAAAPQAGDEALERVDRRRARDRRPRACLPATAARRPRHVRGRGCARRARGARRGWSASPGTTPRCASARANARRNSTFPRCDAAGSSSSSSASLPRSRSGSPATRRRCSGIRGTSASSPRSDWRRNASGRRCARSSAAMGLHDSAAAAGFSPADAKTQSPARPPLR